jgi:hypothetical protein
MWRTSLRKGNSHCTRCIGSEVQLKLVMRVELLSLKWIFIRLRNKERPPDMVGSCEYIKQTASDNQQGVVVQLGCWARG